MSEREEFLRKEDFRGDPNITQGNIDEINNHPRGDCELSQIEKEEIANRIKADVELYERTIPKKGIENTLENLDYIWTTYQDIRTKNKLIGNTQSIYLVTKGIRIKSVGQCCNYSGYLESNILAVRTKNSRTLLHLCHSFNDRGEKVLAINYDQDQVKHYKNLRKDADFFAFDQEIDLHPLHNVDKLRKKIKKSKS